MSRIYSNDPLSSLPVKNVFIESEWNPSAHQNGEGVLLEGSVKGISRFVVNDSAKKKYRYFLIVTQVVRGYKRIFDEAKVEIEVDLTKSDKVRTGYLQSSYKVVQRDALTMKELISLTQRSEVLEKFSVNKMDGDDCLALLLEESMLENCSISVNDEVRLRTKGFEPFVESFSKINEATKAKSHYAGDEDIGGNWTSKIMAAKEHQSNLSPPPSAGAAGKNDCVADDEWGD